MLPTASGWVSVGARVLGWTAGGALGACLGLFLTNWAGAPLDDYLPRILFMVTMQAGYVTFLLAPGVLALVLTVWIVRRLWRWGRWGEKPMIAPKKPLLVLGIALGVLILVSHARLTMQLAELQADVQPFARAYAESIPRPVPSYTDGNSTFGSMKASPFVVTAPDGTALRGVYEADLIGGVVTVIPDDASKGQADERMNPQDFRRAFSDEATDLTNRMLLELHGWPRERWPEGWSP